MWSATKPLLRVNFTACGFASAATASRMSQPNTCNGTGAYNLPYMRVTVRDRSILRRPPYDGGRPVVCRPV